MMEVVGVVGVVGFLLLTVLLCVAVAILIFCLAVWVMSDIFKEF